MIVLDEVHKAFGPRHVLRGFSLTLAAGETVVLLGRSGTGKSVTLKLIVGLLRPDHGRVLVDEVDVGAARGARLGDVRRKVAFLFQTGALVNWMSVRDNVALPLVEHGGRTRREIDARVDETLAQVELLEAAAQFPAEISGGMRKRAALARVLVQDPAAVLYDEPTAGLDPILARTVGGIIRRVQTETRRAALVVTHDLEFAFGVADRIGLHHEGRLVELADPDTFRASRHPVVRAFLDGGPPPSSGDRSP